MKSLFGGNSVYKARRRSILLWKCVQHLFSSAFNTGRNFYRHSHGNLHNVILFSSPHAISQLPTNARAQFSQNCHSNVCGDSSSRSVDLFDEEKKYFSAFIRCSPIKANVENWSVPLPSYFPLKR